MMRLALFCQTFAVVCSLVESGISKRFLCTEAENCLQPRQNFKPYEKYLKVFDLIVESKLQQFCVLAAAQNRCVRYTKSNCIIGYYYSWRAALDNYFCSVPGKSEIRNLSRSPCSNNFERQSEVRTSFGMCLIAYSKRRDELGLGGPSTREKDKHELPPFNEWKTCCVNVATDTCGPEYGQFVQSVVNNDEIHYDLLLYSR